MKILLISYNRIGDTILSTGLIDHLLRKYDNASFSIVTSSISACIYQDLPKLEPTKIVDKGEFFEWIDKKGRKKRQPLWFYEALLKAKTSAERSTLRSKTFKGIAKAMATQKAIESNFFIIY